MPTPQSEEELNLGLAKLYAARVPRLREAGLSYELAMTLVAMARRSNGLEGLKDVLGVADVVVQTRKEFNEALAKAEARGQARAGTMTVLEEVPLQPEEASLPEEAVVPGSRCWGSSAMGNAAPRGTRKPTSSQSVSSGVKQGNSDEARDVPLLSVISTFVPGEPQVITLHLSGQWGIKVSPCSVNL